MACLEDPPLSFSAAHQRRRLQPSLRNQQLIQNTAKWLVKPIAALKERGGSSRQAILKYIMAISVYDADADLREDTYKNIYKF
jgi:hypothetical protein